MIASYFRAVEVYRLFLPPARETIIELSLSLYAPSVKIIYVRLVKLVDSLFNY